MNENIAELWHSTCVALQWKFRTNGLKWVRQKSRFEERNENAFSQFWKNPDINKIIWYFKLLKTTRIYIHSSQYFTHGTLFIINLRLRRRLSCLLFNCWRLFWKIQNKPHQIWQPLQPLNQSRFLRSLHRSVRNLVRKLKVSRKQSIEKQALRILMSFSHSSDPSVEMYT